VHIEDFQRPRGRTGNVSTVQIVKPIVTSTPYLVHVLPVLDRAAKMSTGRRNCVVSSITVHDQKARTVSESKNLRAVRLQVRDLRRYNFIAAKVGDRWRNDILDYWVKK
jgi:hypothetical protein